MDASYLELLDWRRRVAELFAELRRRPPDADDAGLVPRREGRAVPRPPAESDSRGGSADASRACAYWPCDPTARVVRAVRRRRGRAERPGGRRGGVPAHRRPRVRAATGSRCGWPRSGSRATPAVCSCRSPTRPAAHETYGGGRYLLDTIKSADLGSDCGWDHGRSSTSTTPTTRRAPMIPAGCARWLRRTVGWPYRSGPGSGSAMNQATVEFRHVSKQYGPTRARGRRPVAAGAGGRHLRAGRSERLRQDDQL